MSVITYHRAIKRIRESVGLVINRVLGLFVSFFDLFFGNLQRWLGIRRMPYVFALPNLLIFGIFILFPMALNFWYATTGGTEFFPGDRTWVGTQNFEQLLTCDNFFDPNTCREDLFWRAVHNSVGYVIAQVSLMVLFSLLTALVLNRNIKGRGFFRSVFFYPVLLSPIVVALIWKWILQENGVLNAIITAMGFDKVPFMVDATWARFWVVMISVWAYMGFYTLILLAGLQAIPRDVYEAADIDGANKWQSFWQITLPLLMPNMLVVLVLSLIRAVQVFDVVFAFTGGGPGSATRFLVQYIYDNGFSSPTKRYGIAAAASLLMAGTLVVLTLLQLRLNREEA
ncbi:MAG: sugar ABC transporter permease [Candidatus Thermofonsia bacterium]|nr:MAG: sugar ABC transporter permease [Candidatus Thermofonsia bacterium]